jgi:hypothetical protein
MYYSPITKGRGICERRVANGGVGSTLRVKSCPFYKAIKKTDQTLIFDLPVDRNFNPGSDPKEQMIVAIRQAEKEMITRTETQIRELRDQIAEIISTRESYQLGVEAAINVIKSSK